MSVIRPFAGLRPTPEMAADVAAPPYDVLSSDEARELVKQNPNSFLRVNKSEVDFPPDTDAYGEEIYQRGKENLQRLIDEKIMIRDSRPCYYLYRLTMNNRSQTGLVCLSSVAEYDKNLIKKHEHTRPKKVSDRANHIQILGAQVGPVFSIFRNSDKLSTLFRELTKKTPEYDFVGEYGVRHELWVVADEPQVEALTNAFADLPALYIADGHHRSAAASEVCRRLAEKNPNHTGDEHYNYFLNVVFPDDELHILSYNRVVTDLGGLSREDLLAKIEEKFAIARADAPVTPQRDKQVGMYINGQWYVLSIKPGTYDENDPAASIDSAVLTMNLLDPILGIKDIRTDERIDFVGGIRGTQELVKLVDSGKFAIAFSMYPVSVEQLLAVADAEQVMPPKSTWFEPKLRSGMVVNLLSE
ncbi:DUF1015 family protein [candidate division GN15 bacterium]|nr:DUF1015 family protein [candidate division GN15 bacterium]